jgi:hypothetical protein
MNELPPLRNPLLQTSTIRTPRTSMNAGLLGPRHRENGLPKPLVLLQPVRLHAVFADVFSVMTASVEKSVFDYT